MVPLPLLHLLLQAPDGLGLGRASSAPGAVPLSVPAGERMRISSAEWQICSPPAVFLGCGVPVPGAINMAEQVTGKASGGQHAQRLPSLHCFPGEGGGRPRQTCQIVHFTAVSRTSFAWLQMSLTCEASFGCDSPETGPCCMGDGQFSPPCFYPPVDLFQVPGGTARSRLKSHCRTCAAQLGGRGA